MDIAMFFEFPGILITIGVTLLLISIIIIIVAYRSDIKDVDASKLSTNYHRRNDDIVPKDEDKKEVVLENKSEELDNDKKDLEKTKIFKPSEIRLEEQATHNENSGQPRPMGIKDMLEDINKVDDKKEPEKEETVDIFTEEFDLKGKLEEPKQEVKEQKEEDKKPELQPVIEEDEDIELL